MESRLETIIRKQERTKFLSGLQSEAEREGHIPPMPSLLLRKLEKPLQYTGGVLWGLFLGIIASFISFVIAVKILHLQF